MDLRFRLLVILLLFAATSHCFPNASSPSKSGISTPITIAYNTTTSPLYDTTISNTSTSSTFDKSSKIQSPTTYRSLLNIVTLTNAAQKTTSELKCGEYAEEIANLTAPVGGFLNKYESGRPIFIINYCELWKRSSTGKTNTSLGIGGRVAYPGEYPHMVALGTYNSDGIFILLCGGTLISHTWVLTAAHCTHAPNGAATHARIGINRLTGRRYGITISIKNMVRHPDYRPPALYADVALVELATSVNFSLLMHPACLYQQFYMHLQYSSQATVTGWGATEIDGEQSDYLQVVELSVIDNLNCSVQYNTSREIPHGITSSMICAGGDGNKDACHGDSGGPLQISENTCMPHIIGITSFGRSCGVTNLPGVYTRVSHYVPWIENIVWPQ